MANGPTTRTSTRSTDPRPADHCPGDSVERWQQYWFPVAFSQDLSDQPHRFEIHGRGYVLFRAEDASLTCLVDRCPHRAARLSDGVMRDGKLECLYHGWQFDGDGSCVRIPQLPAGQSIPAKANVSTLVVIERQGMVWVWPGAVSEADQERIPTIPDLDREDARSVDFTIDLPYEQTFLIENVIDIAHIHIAHDGVRGGGVREFAAPIHFEIEQSSAAGLRASFRSMDASLSADGPVRGAQVEFRAPNLVHYESRYVDEARYSGLALYSLPSNTNGCRLLYRAYSNFPRLRDRLRPRWFEHWTQCLILEQDMDVVIGQVEQIRGSNRPPREIWLPIKTSDSLVLAYRKWLDEHAADWPYAVGFARVSAASSDGSAQPPTFDRYAMHTAICASCSGAHRFTLAMRTPLIVAVVVFLAGAAVLSDPLGSAVAGGLAILTSIVYVLLTRAEARFR